MPKVFPLYLVHLAPATVVTRQRPDSPEPVRYRKAGMCRRCTLAIKRFIEESWHGENRDQHAT